MKDKFLKDYILLTLRIDKLFKQEGSYYIDSYLGPESLKIKVDNEEIFKPIILINDTKRLINRIENIDFEFSRKEYIKKHLLAFQTILMILNKDDISFENQVKDILDIDLVWTDEKVFEKGLKLFDEGLPGSGDLIKRYKEWLQRNTYTFNNEQIMLKTINELIEVVRDYSSNIVDLPNNDDIIVELVSNKNYGAETRYIGNLISKLNINKDLPFNFFQAIPLIAHELYPGHHTEFCIKEKFLVKTKGYYESQVFLLNSPQLVITEGIGEVAFDLIISNDSFLNYLINNIYKKYNIKINDVDLKSILVASRINSIDQIANNAVMMFEDGKSEEEIKNYVKKYSLQPDFMLDHLLSNIKNSQFNKIYSITYYQGKKMVEDYINKENKLERFNNLLKNQFYPTQLLNN